MMDLKSLFPDDYTGDYIDMKPDEFKVLEGVIPTEVCHYTRMDIALEKILHDRKILLRKITSTNDPRESKEHLLSTIVPVADGEVLQFDSGPNFLNEWRVFCTSCHNNPRGQFRPTLLSCEKYGVAYPNMWAHYGGNHNGVCLIFDGAKLNRNIRQKEGEVFYGFVKYDYDKATCQLPMQDPEFQTCERAEMIRRSQKKHFNEIFLYKTPHWRYEHEFRWLIHNQNASEIFISIEGHALLAVVFGEDFNDVYLPSFREVCERLSVPLYQIKWVDGSSYIFRKEI
jgi:Protein of unknown function (DUF2971)